MSVCQNSYLRKVEGRYHYDPVRGITSDIYQVPCGKCTNCKIQISKEWALRCCLELPYWDKAVFTTLTVNNENWLNDVSLHKEEFSDFVKNLRNELRAKKYRGRKIKILGCGEYGDKGRKHYHAIIFGIGLSDEKRFIGTDETYISEDGLIEKAWLKGNVFNGTVTYESCRYTASYVFKKYYDEMKEEVYTSKGLENPFQHTSGGIGRRWWEEYKDITLQRGYIMFNGIKHTIPHYYLELITNEKGRTETENQTKLKELQEKHAMNKFEEWYNEYIKKLTKKLCEDPNIYNFKTLKEAGNEDFYRFWSKKYIQETDKQNKAKANLANAKNNQF